MLVDASLAAIVQASVLDVRTTMSLSSSSSSSATTISTSTTRQLFVTADDSSHISLRPLLNLFVDDGTALTLCATSWLTASTTAAISVDVDDIDDNDNNNNSWRTLTSIDALVERSLFERRLALLAVPRCVGDDDNDDEKRCCASLDWRAAACLDDDSRADSLPNDRALDDALAAYFATLTTTMTSVVRGAASLARRRRVAVQLRFDADDAVDATLARSLAAAATLGPSLHSTLPHDVAKRLERKYNRVSSSVRQLLSFVSLNVAIVLSFSVPLCCFHS